VASPPGPAAMQDRRVDSTHSAILPPAGNAPPTGREQGREPAATELDPASPPPPRAAIGDRSRSIPDSPITAELRPGEPIDAGVATDRLLPAPHEMNRAEALDIDTTPGNGEGARDHADRTVTHSGPLLHDPEANRAPDRAVGPQIPGYEILGKLGEGG